MNKRKKLISVLAGIMAGIMLLGLLLSMIPVANAASSSEIRNQINELKDQQEELQTMMEDLQNQYQENESEIANIVARKNVIDQEIFLLNAKIANINEQINAFSLLIADKQDELDEAAERLETLNDKYRERIRTMEEEGSLSYWAVLFQANSFADLLDRLNMIEEIASADRRRLQEMNKATRELEEALKALQLEKDDLEETKSELDAAYEELDAKKAEAQVLIGELVARAAELEELYGEYENLDNELDEEIARKEQEYNEAKFEEWLAYMATYTTAPPETTKPTEAETEAGNTGGNEGSSQETEATETTEATEPPKKEEGSGNGGNNGNGSSGGTWLVPCSYRKLTSPFGERDAPTAGASTFHKGVDLAGPEGTHIYASRGGTVTIASYSNSGGFYVTINHGDGYSSSYLHMTGYTVSTGQRVSAGQLIGYMGSTGISTGSHLHFSIYYQGVAVNPAHYVPLG